MATKNLILILLLLATGSLSIGYALPAHRSTPVQPEKEPLYGPNGSLSRSTNAEVVCEIQFFMVPPDVTLDCADLPVTSEPIPDWNQDCCEPITMNLQMDTLPGVCPVLFTLVRTWTASDECGNSASTQQVVTVRDITPPVFTVLPDNITVMCDLIPPVPVVGVDVQATDDCGTVNITSASVTVPGVCPQEYLVVRTWVAIDACQNSSVVQRTMLVRDIEPPSFVDPPQDVTIHCLAPVPPVDTIIAEDNCSDQVWFTFNESLSGGNYCQTLTRTRTWVAEDMCGNRNTHTQTIVQTDSGPPVFLFVPADTVGECGSLPDQHPIVEDDCDPDPEVSLSTTIIPGFCPGNYTLIRTWTATDGCGNSSTASQTVQVSDTTPPVITFTDTLLAQLPNGDTLLQPCEATVIYGVDDAHVEDACDPNPDVIFIDSLIWDDGCKKLLYCEWQSTDHCGNVASYIFYMLVGDFTPPVIGDIPADITLNCQAPLPPPFSPSVTDDCDLGPKIEFTEETLPGNCPFRYTVRRIWTARDFCGNTSQKIQTITITDNQAPVINALHPILIGQPNNAVIETECTQIPVLNAQSVSASDNCSAQATISLTRDTINANCLTEGYFRQITYTWRATDECGNQSVFIIHLRITDQTPPVFTTFPADQTVSCDQPLPQVTPTASDACTSPVVLQMAEVVIPQNCGYRLQRTWTATDGCGNTTSRIHQITVRDQTAPVIIDYPDDITVSCDVALPAPGPVSVNDNCDSDPELSLQESTLPGNCPGQYTVFRTWTASDSCGNTALATQRITVIDTLAPVFIQVPPDDTITCEEIPQGTEGVIVTDACHPSVPISVSLQTIPGNCPGNYQIIRTFTAHDGCGNTATASQTLWVIDNDPPVFGFVPSPLSLSCELPVPTPPVQDDCDPSPVLTYFDTNELPGLCDGERQFLRTWTVTDHCGNSASTTQLIIYTDDTPPVLVPVDPDLIPIPNGAEITVECHEVPLMDVHSVQVTDLCDPDPEVTFEEEVSFGNCQTDGYHYILTCIWRAEDDCGNVSTYTIYLRVVDTQAPWFLAPPQDITVDPTQGDSIPAPLVLEAKDHCDDHPVVAVTESEIQLDCYRVLTRVWTATDFCGNSSTVSQQVTILEDCPCHLPVVESVQIRRPKLGQNDGEITIITLQDPSLFEYQWLPNTGVPQGAGNVRTGLPPGMYAIIIRDPAGGPACLVKVDVVLTERTSCVDTVYIQRENVAPVEVCLDQVIDFPGAIGAAQLCGMDSSQVLSVNFLPGTACVIIQPVIGFTGTTEICVIHCDEAQPAVCDTTYIFLTVQQLKPCDPVFPTGLVEQNAQDCDTHPWVCLPARPEKLEEYLILVDGVEYDKDLEGCDWRTFNSYQVNLIPGEGLDGPYLIELWTVGGIAHTGGFYTLEDLVAWMQQTDPDGQWAHDPLSGRLVGQPNGKTYGSLVVRQVSTNSLKIVGYQSVTLAYGTRMYLGEGSYGLEMIHSDPACSSFALLAVTCDHPEEQLVAVDDTAFTQRDNPVIIPILANDYFPNGDPTQLYLISWPTQGTVYVRPDNKLVYSPTLGYCGPDSLDYVVCDVLSCDTARVRMEVRCRDLEVKNGISPNGDGINDTFVIKGIEGYPDNSLVIYNRWGNEVYHTQGYKNSWRGTWNGQELPDGTYFYHLDTGEGEVLTGYLQIQR